MVTKKTSKKNIEKTISKEILSSETKHCNLKENTPFRHKKTMLIGVLALLVLQLILTFFIISSLSQISTINDKVSKIDSFFLKNGLYSDQGQANQNAQPTPTQNPTDLKVDIVNKPFLGNATAPVTIIEYSDFECPFCGRFVSETLPQLKTEYINTGKVKLVYKNFPLGFHKMAMPAALASTCVYDELGNEAFLNMYDKIFQNQQSMSESNLETWALEIGVDKAKYQSCIADPKVKSRIDADLAEGAANGVTGTPSFIINGELIVGAQPFSVFKQTIDTKLSN